MRFVQFGILALLSVAGLCAAGLNSRIADAAEAGDRAAVRALIQQKGDLNAAQADGMTARDDRGPGEQTVPPFGPGASLPPVTITTRPPAPSSSRSALAKSSVSTPSEGAARLA